MMASGKKPQPAFAPGIELLVMFSANGKPVFRDDPDKQRLSDVISGLVAAGLLRVHAYCWLPNEIELLVDPGERAVQEIAQEISAGYARALALLPSEAGGSGPVSDRGTLFSSSQLCYAPRTRTETADVARSIHMRPSVLDIAEDWLVYPWSSARAYAGRESVSWLATDLLKPLLSGGQEPEPEVAPEERRARTAPKLTADAVEEKLTQERAERSKIWLARSLVAWKLTQSGEATLPAAAARLRVDPTALAYSLERYRTTSAGLFDVPLVDVLERESFADAAPRTRKHLVEILKLGA
jgi:hypothetical protein